MTGTLVLVIVVWLLLVAVVSLFFQGCDERRAGR
jgi:hypothetical protein